MHFGDFNDITDRGSSPVVSPTDKHAGKFGSEQFMKTIQIRAVNRAGFRRQLFWRLGLIYVNK